MSDVKKLKVGDTVRVFDRNSRANKASDGVDGTVTKVGTKLVTIAWGWQDAVFRLDTGLVNNGHGGQWFMTMEQFTERERRRAALATIRAHGFDTEWDTKHSLAFLEAVAAAMQDAAQQEGSADV